MLKICLPALKLELNKIVKEHREYWCNKLMTDMGTQPLDDEYIVEKIVEAVKASVVGTE